MKISKPSSLLFCIVAIAPMPSISGEWSQCPAPVVEGRWGIDQSSAALTNAFSPHGTRLLTIPPANETQFVDIAINDCSSNFTLTALSADGMALVFDMTLEEWIDKNGMLYTGSITPFPGFTLSTTWAFGNPYEAVGSLDFDMSASDGTARAAPTSYMHLVIPDDDRDDTRYECNCLSPLQTWINQGITEAKEFRDAYANLEYRNHPRGIPQNKSAQDDNWNSEVYEEVIFAIVGRSMTHADAVKLVADKYFPDGVSTDTSADSTVNSGTRTAAYTDERCVIHYTESHKSSCYPSIEHEATVIHESLHARLCLAAGISAADDQSVAAIANEEVEAYQAEIDYLERFIAEKCESTQ